MYKSNSISFYCVKFHFLKQCQENLALVLQKQGLIGILFFPFVHRFSKKLFYAQIDFLYLYSDAKVNQCTQVCDVFVKQFIKTFVNA